MSSAYRAIGLAILAIAVAGAVGYRIGRAGPRLPESVAADRVECAECALPPAQEWSESMPPIPAGSGLACCVEFGSDECPQCRRMEEVFAALEPRLAGRVDLVRIDTDVHRQAGLRFALRMIPAQVALAADGAELWRHEGELSEAELLAELEKAGVLSGTADTESRS